MSFALTLYGAAALKANEWALIAELRTARGFIVGTFNAGQVALARWLMRAARRDGHVDLCASVSELDTIRLLTGEMDPSPEMAELLARLTVGAVMPHMFATTVKMPAAALSELAAGKAGGSAPSPLPGGRPPHRGGGVVSVDREALVSLHARIGAMLGLDGARC